MLRNKIKEQEELFKDNERKKQLAVENNKIYDKEREKLEEEMSKNKDEPNRFK